VNYKTSCDTSYGRLNIRIINSGKIGFSSVTLKTDSGDIVICGVKPGDTSCYFPISPIYKNAEYHISTLRLRGLRQPFGLTFYSGPKSNVGQEKFSSGFCTMIIELSKKNKKGDISLSKVGISKD